DHATLVAAWRRVVDRLTPGACDPHLLLAGAPGDQDQSLREQAKALSLCDRVHFMGQVTNVNDLLEDVDLVVFSSHAEGLPNAVLEAMAHGRAVVATDYPGIREALGPEYAPLLAAPRDPDDLADKIVLAAQHPELRASMGAMGRDRVVHTF